MLDASRAKQASRNEMIGRAIHRERFPLVLPPRDGGLRRRSV